MTHYVDDQPEKWQISPELHLKMRRVARELRNQPTPTEDKLWQAIRRKQVDGRKFRRQMAIGTYVVDFYCSEERLAVEVDGSVHQGQQEVDQIRQEMIESLGIRFVRVTSEEVEHQLPMVLGKIRGAFRK